MRLVSFGLFMLILGTGAVVETAWQVRERMPGARFGWTMFRGRFQGPSHTFDKPVQSLPLAAGTAVEVANAYGNVKLVPGTTPEARITLRTVVYEENAQQAALLAQQVRLVTETTPQGLRISTNRDEVESAQHGPREAGIETHLEIQVPAGTPARVRNKHGDATVWDVASLDLENAYGTTDVQRVAGAARVANRHGDTRVGDVKGDLQLEAQHGDVEALRTGGGVKLDTEHADVTVTESGAVEAKSSHGDLVLGKVTGSLTVEGVHTGVIATSVTGGATVRTGYRDVELTDVGSDVRVENQHGAVKLTRIAGTVKIENSHDRVEIVDITGAVEIEVENSTVTGRNVAQGATVRARHDAVSIDGFSGPIDISGEQVTVELETKTALTHPVTVKTRHDEVRLVLPGATALALDASASHGHVSVDLPGFTSTKSEDEHVVGTAGSNGPQVRIEADGGSVRVSAGASPQR